MARIKLYIILLFVAVTAPLPAQESFLKFKGQADGYAGLNFSNPIQAQTGLRFIPMVSAGKSWKNKLKFDSEFSFNSYLDYHITDWEKDNSSSGIKPYRMWLRLSSDRFELRAGLQKINFGSATMLRPLMWFDRMDTRDPLQLTDGVYSLLSRYYFKNNANLWLWMLLGNDKPKGWEIVPSVKGIPEFGGRLQLPVPKGETAITYHHRTADLSKIPLPVTMNGSLDYPEDRIGLDGKWDLGVGLWVEYSLTHSKLDTAYFPQYTKMLTLGMDYTFKIGNGLNLSTEFFRYNASAEVFGKGTDRNFSLLSANYPFGISNRASCIVYYNWNDKSWYRIINLQRQSDNWTFYLFLFWNPDKVAIYNTGNENNMFAGKGVQFMTVFNF